MPNKDEVKKEEEQKVDEKSEDVQAAKKEEKKAEPKAKKKEKVEEESQEEVSMDLDEETEEKKEKIFSKDNDLLADLPESVKKKLEQVQTDKKSKKKKIRKKKEKKHAPVGKAFIKATYNNTIVTLTDPEGNVIGWASAGVAGFKGPKKSTSYAGQIITKIAVQKAREAGLEEVSVFVKGVGTGREAAVRALNSSGLNVTEIRDITPIPHNGCRARKPRRV